jgi:hypothetical protein
MKPIFFEFFFFLQTSAQIGKSSEFKMGLKDVVVRGASNFVIEKLR